MPVMYGMSADAARQQLEAKTVMGTNPTAVQQLAREQALQREKDAKTGSSTAESSAAAQAAFQKLMFSSGEPTRVTEGLAPIGKKEEKEEKEARRLAKKRRKQEEKQKKKK